jgi:23S rRNA pseudouridine2605 synthase
VDIRLFVFRKKEVTLSAERLQKVLASAGIASRRDCEELISAGRVSVNGKVVHVPGTRVDPEQDEIAVDGRPIGRISPRTYVMLHKPAGVVSTADDPQGRPTVVELVDLPKRLFSVGRLDFDSEGLLLMTDDGELTQRLTHPSYQIEKEYRALLDQPPSPDALREWRNGVLLEGVPTAPAWVDLLERGEDGAWVRVVLHEGRKRQIREVARLLGYEVLRLIRVREGPVLLGDLPAGEWRNLTDDEVEALWSYVGGRDAELPADTADSPATLEVGAATTRRHRERPMADRPRRSTRASAPREDQAEAFTVEDDQADQPRESRPRQSSNERPVPRRAPRSDDARGKRDDASYEDRSPRRDDGSYEARGPRRDDRPYQDRGPRRDDRPYPDRGPRRDDRPYPDRGPRRDDRPYPDRGPRRDDRSYEARGPRRDDRPYQDRGPRRDDRPYQDRGPRRDDQPYQDRGPRRDDRPYQDRGPRRDDRSYEARGPRRDDRPYQDRGPRRDERPYQDRGPRRDDRPSRDDRSSEWREARREDTRGAPRDRYSRERSRDEQPQWTPDERSDDRPERGNERLPERDQREEKRGPGREWHERTEQERRERPAMRVTRPRFGDQGRANRRVGFPFRPRPPRDDKDKS